jgi:hypothetical protein
MVNYFDANLIRNLLFGIKHKKYLNHYDPGDGYFSSRSSGPERRDLTDTYVGDALMSCEKELGRPTETWLCHDWLVGPIRYHPNWYIRVAYTVSKPNGA